MHRHIQITTNRGCNSPHVNVNTSALWQQFVSGVAVCLLTDAEISQFCIRRVLLWQWHNSLSQSDVTVWISPDGSLSQTCESVLMGAHHKCVSQSWRKVITNNINNDLTEAGTSDAVNDRHDCLVSSSDNRHHQFIINSLSIDHQFIINWSSSPSVILCTRHVTQTMNETCTQNYCRTVSLTAARYSTASLCNTKYIYLLKYTTRRWHKVISCYTNTLITLTRLLNR